MYLCLRRLNKPGSKDLHHHSKQGPTSATLNSEHKSSSVALD